MTQKELLFSALRHETTPRAPWVPFADVHAGKLIGADAQQVLTDEDTLLKALLEVNRLYKPDGQPVVFDLQLEAEILGCELAWAADGPPSVASHPLADTMTVPCLCTLPKPEQGRLPLVLNVMRKMKELVGETTALYGLICGPFTLASHLRGNDLFMDMYDDEDYVHDLLNYCTQCGKAMSNMFLEAGMDVIAVVDPLVSQISSSHFEEFLAEPYTEMFAYIRSKKAFSSFFVCGDATRNIEVMCKTAPDSISVDENVDILAAKNITDLLCESNSCGMYGKSWMCPPYVGEIETLIQQAKQYQYILVYQIIGQLEDSYDFEGMMETGKAMTALAGAVREKMASCFGADALYLAAGGCGICSRCAKLDDQPCRFPQKALASLEAYGIDVSSLAAAANMKYINGSDTVTYFAAVLFHEKEV